MLSSESSAEPGPWHTERVEYTRGFMDAISDASFHTVVGVWGSQLAKTECLLNSIGYYVQHDPAPIMVMAQTLDVAKALSTDRVAPMLRTTPALRDLVSEPRSRDASNKILYKAFPGGHITFAGANSAPSLSSRPIRFLICDEVEGYTASAGTEGDPLELAETRTVAFWNAKRVYISSPRNDLGSRLKELWEDSDQRRFFVACRACGHEQHLRWEQVKFKDADGRSDPACARYECEACSAAWSDEQRWRAVAAGKWRATRESASGVAGFHLNALYAPWEHRRLRHIVRQWLRAQGNKEKLKAFINTVLAEWWREGAEATVTEHELAERARKYDFTRSLVPHTDLPDGVAVLTCGIDGQRSPARLELEVVGWGAGEESWSILYTVIPGDPRRDPNVLADLDRILARPFIHARGHPLWIRGAGIDTGWATQTMYQWAQPRLRRLLPDGRSQFVFALKGRGQQEFDRPIWPRQGASTVRTKGGGARKANLWTIGVHAAKEQIYASLARPEPGPGFWHFPAGRSEDYFKGLTSEHPIPKMRAGRPYMAFEPKAPGRPTEPLDNRVYAYAVFVGLQSDPFGLRLDAEVARTQAMPFVTPPPRGADGLPRLAPAPVAPATPRSRVRFGGIEP